MEIQTLHSKQKIFEFLNKNPGLHIYSIGDLDDFFWPKTNWYALIDNGAIHAIVLLYIGMSTPTVLSFCEKENSLMKNLLAQIKPMLPPKFNAHLSEGLIDVFGRENILTYYGFTKKMYLTKKVIAPKDKNIRRLEIGDIKVIEEFYKIAYPDNWFDSRMLLTNKYFGYFLENKLVGVSGIHVYSETYKVAALGNIATHPDYRGKQIGYKLTAVLCNDLQRSIDAIGLNVKADNIYAIKAYEKTGFEIIANYDECFINNGL